MTENLCPDCGRPRGTSQEYVGQDSYGDLVLGPEVPSGYCKPCVIGIDPGSVWPRPRLPQFDGLPTTACGFVEMPDGTLIPPRDQY